MGALEYIIGGAAVLISAISLALAISANRTQERLLAASTWPFLQFTTGNRGDDGKSAIHLNMQNAGVGPARIRVVQLEYSGKYQADARSLLNACCGANGKGVTTITSGAEKVIGAGEVITLLRFDEADSDPAIWQAFNKERFKIRVAACYCSVLGECWLMDSMQSEAQPLSACPLVDEASRWHG